MQNKKLKIRTSVRSGALTSNHSGIKVRTKVRSGALTSNHSSIKV
jgi:hypothetical protein